MSQEEVASAGLTRQTVVKLEQYTSLTQERTLRDLRKVFEDIGIEFLFADGKGIGLRKRDI